MLQGIDLHRARALALALIAGLLAVWSISMAFTAQASAGTDICEQYPDTPGCDEGPGGGGGGNDDGNDQGDNGDQGDQGGNAGPSANAGDTGNGNLPFTGYPLTALILLLLVLLLAGLALRSYLAIRNRLERGERTRS